MPWGSWAALGSMCACPGTNTCACAGAPSFGNVWMNIVSSGAAQKTGAALYNVGQAAKEADPENVSAALTAGGSIIASTAQIKAARQAAAEQAGLVPVQMGYGEVPTTSSIMPWVVLGGVGLLGLGALTVVLSKRGR